MGRTACTEPQCLYKGALYLYLLIYVSGSRVMFETRRFIVEITPQVFIGHASLCKMRIWPIAHVRRNGWKLPKRATRHPFDCFGQLPSFRNITERNQSRRVAKATAIINLPNFSFLNHTLKLKQIFNSVSLF